MEWGCGGGGSGQGWRWRGGGDEVAERVGVRVGRFFLPYVVLSILLISRPHMEPSCRSNSTVDVETSHGVCSFNMMQSIGDLNLTTHNLIEELSFVVIVWVRRREGEDTSCAGRQPATGSPKPKASVSLMDS